MKSTPAPGTRPSPRLPSAGPRGCTLRVSPPALSSSGRPSASGIGRADAPGGAALSAVKMYARALELARAQVRGQKEGVVEHGLGP